MSHRVDPKTVRYFESRTDIFLKKCSAEEKEDFILNTFAEVNREGWFICTNAKPQLPTLAFDACGSRVVEAVWKASADFPDVRTVREEMAKTFSQCSDRLNTNLRGRRIQSDEIMVSFDVTSLFTSIPPNVAREVLRKRLEEAYDETQNALKIEHLMRLFEFCQQTFFTFAGETYEQIKGTPMGSPVSGLVAELVLQELEKIAFIQHEPGVPEVAERIVTELGVGVAHRPKATMRNMVMKIKDRLKPEEQSGVVYRIPCQNCHCNYTGQMERMLGSRIHEHKLVVRRGDALSQVAAHTYEMGHELNFADTKIVAHAGNKRGRELIEVWASDENSLNRFIYRAPCSATSSLASSVDDWPKCPITVACSVPAITSEDGLLHESASPGQETKWWSTGSLQLWEILKPQLDAGNSQLGPPVTRNTGQAEPCGISDQQLGERHHSTCAGVRKLSYTALYIPFSTNHPPPL
nr:unnamed protein product [Spirometra erinaceieuropaei]